MINESAIKQAFSKIREEFELLRKEIKEIKSINNGNQSTEVQDIKNKIEEIKTKLSDIVSPEDGKSSKQIKETTKENKIEGVIPVKSIPVSEENKGIDEDLQEVNALADEYY